MTFTEWIVIGSGLVVGYWLVAVFIPNVQSKPLEDEEPTPERPSQDQAHERASDKYDAWHTVLGVSPNAGHGEIVAAYKRLIAQYHPDKVATMGAEIREIAARRSTAINIAYREAMKQRRA